MAEQNGLNPEKVLWEQAGWDIQPFVDKGFSVEQLKVFREYAHDMRINPSLNYDPRLSPEQLQTVLELQYRDIPNEVFNSVENSPEKMRLLFERQVILNERREAEGEDAFDRTYDTSYNAEESQRQLREYEQKVDARLAEIDKKLVKIERSEKATGSKEEKIMANEKQEYTPEEKAAWREQRKAEVSDLKAQAEQGIRDVLDNGQLPGYLRMMGKMPGYDYQNTMLVMQQRPGATCAKSSAKWKSQAGRSIVKGEKSVRIIIPKAYEKMVDVPQIDKTTGLALRDTKGEIVKQKQTIQSIDYNPVSVFDVTQTHGKEFTPPEPPKLITGDEKDFALTMRTLERVSPVPIKYKSLKNGEKGIFDPKKNEITVCKGLTEAETVDTTIKCMAAAKVHEYNMNHPEQAASLDPRLAEVKAQSIAFVTSTRLGLDTSQYQFPDTKDWSGIDMKQIKSTMNGICATAGKMSHDVTRGLEKEQSRERAKENVAKMDHSKMNVTYEHGNKRTQGQER